jgi:hypothetical protein
VAGDGLALGLQAQDRSGPALRSRRGGRRRSAAGRGACGADRIDGL